MEHCKISGVLSISSLPALQKCSLKGDIGDGFTTSRFESLKLKDLPALEASAAPYCPAHSFPSSHGWLHISFMLLAVRPNVMPECFRKLEQGSCGCAPL